jgi:uncharacterized protein YbaR (Trm112 family)
MISQQLLDILRCPLDRQVRLEPADGGLVCRRCRVRYPVREGIPCLLPEEAELPEGCDSLGSLPCQRPTGEEARP